MSEEIYPDVMIDLETLGIRQDAPIVSIGAAMFDPATGAVGKTFYERVEWVHDQKDRPLDRGTVEWWLKQEKAAQDELTNREGAIKLGLALHRLDTFIPKDARVWANGVNFDIVILDDAYQNQCGRMPPWGFRAPRDCRTLRWLAEPFLDFKQFVPVGTAHNALDDCIFQIKWTSAAFQVLQGKQA